MKIFSVKGLFSGLRRVAAAIYGVLGIVIIVQIVASIGLRFEAIPALALGGAMIALSAVRSRPALEAFALVTVLIHVQPIGVAIAFSVLISITVTLWWMLHPPHSRADIAARAAEQTLKRLVGSIIVVFSPEIRSEHMMALAARIAKGQKADVLAAYVIEVPFMLPATATMEDEDRAALDTLAAAEAIAQKYGTPIRTTTLHHRQTAQAVLELAKAERAHLIVMGSYREGKYTGAPLGRAIEQIAARAKCDVLIGVEGEHGTVLSSEVNGEAKPAEAPPLPR